VTWLVPELEAGAPDDDRPVLAELVPLVLVLPVLADPPEAAAAEDEVLLPAELTPVVLVCVARGSS
jgi:hypothetical protein